MPADAVQLPQGWASHVPGVQDMGLSQWVLPNLWCDQAAGKSAAGTNPTPHSIL